jgi:hypothetical protein
MTWIFAVPGRPPHTRRLLLALMTSSWLLPLKARRLTTPAGTPESGNSSPRLLKTALNALGTGLKLRRGADVSR